MAGREGTTEGGTSLTVTHVAVGKEQAALCCKAIGNNAGLAHEAILQLGIVQHRRAIVDNRILADNTHANLYHGIRHTLKGTVLQTQSTIYLATVIDAAVYDTCSICDANIIAYGSDWLIIQLNLFLY